MSTASKREDKSHPRANIFRTFMLRCWREGNDEPGLMNEKRFVLVEMDTEQTRKGFANLDELVVYLRNELE